MDYSCPFEGPNLVWALQISNALNGWRKSRKTEFQMENLSLEVYS